MKRSYHHIPKRITPPETRKQKLQDRIDLHTRPKLRLPYGAIPKAGAGLRFAASGARVAHRRRDHAIPAAVVAAGATLLRGADFPMRSTWFADLMPGGRLLWLTPRWWWTPLAAGTLALLHHRLPRLADAQKELERERLEARDWARFHSYCNLDRKPIGLFIKYRPHSTTYVIKPKPATTDTLIHGMIDDLARGFEAPAGVTIDKQKNTALWEVTVWGCDLLATDRLWTGDLPVSVRSLPYGYDHHGHLLRFGLLYLNMMVSGAPGAGKSSWVKALVMTIAQIHPTLRRIHFADPQKGVSFASLRRVGSSFATTGPEIKAQVRNLLGIVEERSQTLSDDENDMVTISPACPWLILVFDEVADINDACDDETLDMIHQLLRKGRKAGVSVVLCSQSFEASVIPSEWRKLIAVKVGFRVERHESNKINMDVKAADGVDLTLIPVDQPGRGWMDAGLGLTEFRGIRSFGDQHKQDVARLSASLSPMSPTPVADAGATTPETVAPPPSTPIRAVVSDELNPLSSVSFDPLPLEYQIVEAIVESGPTPIRSEAIAERLGCSTRTVQRWAKKHEMVPRGLPDGTQGWVHPQHAGSR